MKAGVRILFKSFRLAWRAQKRFWAFIAVYFVLIGMVTYLLVTPNTISVLLAIFGGLVVATLYGFLLTSFRKTEIATLKCIGWSNNNIRLLIVGEILLISVLAFILFIEIGVHIVGLAYYFGANMSTPTLPILLQYTQQLQGIFIARGLLPWAFVIVVFAQLPGILLANYRILAVKPMEALRMP